VRQRSPRPDDGGAQQHELMATLLPAGERVESLLRRAQFFTPGSPSQDYRELHRRGGRGAEEFYRERWRHDKEVRSTHGVNCTGSCSWKVYVKDGIITWETRQTDYPSVGPDSPEYEPRGCPRGASFSWYTYSPSRVRYPYVRGPLLQMWHEARTRLGDPVLAWAEITGDPERTARYKGARGKRRVRPLALGRGQRADRRRPRAHHQGLRSWPGGRLLPDPGDVHGVLLRGGRGSCR
jgi:nitrate reductase / nitrite oxidoreductase, alpha subunit